MTTKHHELDMHQLGVAKMIKKNYTALYETAGRYAGCPMSIGSRLSWVNNSHLWPNRVYGLNVPESEVDGFLEEVLAGMRSGELPEVLTTSLYTRPAHFEPYFEKHGLVKLFDAEGMAVELGKLQEAFPVDLPVETRRVSEGSELAEWCAIVMEALFEKPVSAMEPYHKAISSLVADGSIHCFIGRTGGKAVATSMLFVSENDVAGIYHVATLPSYRGKGVGKQIALAPLAYARDVLGCTIGVLFATRQGEHIYKQLGFRSYCRFGRYTFTKDL